MSDNGVAQRRVGQAGQHSHLYHGHDLARFRADHCEAKNTIVARGNERLHKALRFVDRVRPKHGARWQLCDPYFDTLTLRVAFAQSYPCELAIRKHAIGDQPVASRAVCPGQIVSNDPEVVKGYVGELRAAGTFSDRPDIGRASLQALVDPYVATTVQFNSGRIEPDTGGVRRAPCRNQDVAAL